MKGWVNDASIEKKKLYTPSTSANKALDEPSVEKHKLENLT